VATTEGLSVQQAAHCFHGKNPVMVKTTVMYIV